MKFVHIPTSGQSHSKKQHPIDQALEADADAEITRMVMDRIIEPCNDSKGFKSPVFAVCKKNGAVQVAASFKRTLNKVDFDP